MKRVLSLVLVLAMLLGLSAAASAAELSGTITYSTWGSETEKQINEAIIAAFMEENPGCTVNLEYIPSSYTEKIDTLLLVARLLTSSMVIRTTLFLGRTMIC